jgi:monofunctional biosynthetic peptidoglycan transglycosylase
MGQSPSSHAVAVDSDFVSGYRCAAMLRVLRFLVWTLVWFVGLSVALVVLYRFAPVPVTATMLMDEHGITKDWEPLANIDRNMVRAVIAGEDGKFCEHDGFDREAIEKAIERNARGGRIRGGSTISQQPPRTCSCGRAVATYAKGSRPGSRC